MTTKISQLREDLDKLIKEGQLLYFRMLLDVGLLDEKTAEEAKKAELPAFKENYEKWYSMAMQVVKQLLPDRYEDFVRQYRNDKRKETDSLTYTISDYLLGIVATRGVHTVVDTKAGVPKFEQQLNILQSARERFERAIFDIRQILQADMFDDELDAARELLKKGFGRAAGALAGVVIERHLCEICENHKISIKKQNPTINDYNEALKNAETVDVATWRFVQHLGDLRNLCSHKKDREPKAEEIEELIAGTAKVTKTVY